MKIYLIRHGDPDYENDTLTVRGTAVLRCLMIGALPHLYRSGLEPTRAGIKANHE